jgi:hypothetical protein
LLFETDKRFGEDQKTLDISQQYSLESSLTMSNYSFFHNSIRLPLVILNFRAFSSKSSYFIFNKRTSINITPYKMPQSRILYNGARNDYYPAFWNRFCQKLSEEGIYYVLEPNYRRLTVGNAPVSYCLDPRCYACAIQFATLADRKEHEQVVHNKRQKKKKQGDNDNIAVNLATMDTCGDCDDEDA